MARMRNLVAILATASIVTGCSYISDTLFPSLSGEEPSKQRERVSIPPSQAERAGQPVYSQPAQPYPVQAGGRPPLGTTSFEPRPMTPGQPTGTHVGRKIVTIRNEMRRLQGTIAGRNRGLQQIREVTVRNSHAYHGTVAAVNTRLQMGTTPGNPILVRQWNLAQDQLNRVGDDVTKMNTLANGVAADSATAAYLLETTRATFGLSGAVDEDHRQLAILEDDVNRTVVLIDRLLGELNEDINRQTNYLGSERKNLTTTALAIKNGELLGTSLSNRAIGQSVPLSTRPRGGGPRISRFEPAPGSRRPLVVIRFDRPDVAFEQPLYSAVNRALQRRPNAAFDLVAVVPGQGSPSQVALNTNAAKRNAETVLRSLSAMGLPADRVSLSATTSASARSSEVHLYVR